MAETVLFLDRPVPQQLQPPEWLIPHAQMDPLPEVAGLMDSLLPLILMRSGLTQAELSTYVTTLKIQCET